MKLGEGRAFDVTSLCLNKVRYVTLLSCDELYPNNDKEAKWLNTGQYRLSVAIVFVFRGGYDGDEDPILSSGYHNLTT
ncbi:unnamed protein product [Taenia asiatica]|uniref:BTB/POZ domain-containing protein n=1 Tax=Taenia asiatica TaxID=60517 RepID=A0A0R3W1X5_TAEAS|nr:unnamed protein product [Taenia asiatica]